MGLYDYLGEEQVKIFYSPSIWSNTITHIGGSLIGYSIGEELPLQTPWYKYPKNFVIYDYRSVRENIIIVKDGRLHSIKPFEELTEEDLGDGVFDYYGTELNIECLDDFTFISDCFNLWMENKRKVEYSYFEKGALWEISNNAKRFESLKDEYYEKLSTLKSCMQCWFVNRFQNEKTLGECMECLSHLEAKKEERISEYNFCKNKIRELIKEDEYLVEKYLDWVDIESLQDMDGYKEWLTEFIKNL